MVVLSEAGSTHALIEHSDRPTPKRLPQLSVSAILSPISVAIDLAEGRTAGHARRVAFIAMSLAGALGLDRETQIAACHAGLMHDIGVIAAGARVAGATRGDERLIFSTLPLLNPEEAVAGFGDASPAVVDGVAQHVSFGAFAARDLGLSEDVAQAIATHHERWDGEGYPDGLMRDEIPVLGRIVGLADHVEALIDQSTPLLARRNFAYWLKSMAGQFTDVDVVDALMRIGSGDSFWLGLFSGDLVAELTARSAQLREPKGTKLLAVAESFARLVDSRFEFTRNVSTRVAAYAEGIGRAIELPEVRMKQLRVAALLHDVGQLSIPERVLSKPGILSVDELGALQLHTIQSRDVVADIAGLDDVADWVVSHHERIDGRGYPEGRSGDEIPLEARILAVADAFVAITSDRPYRPRAEGREARERLLKAAGTQLDARLVDLFLHKVLA